VNERTVSVRGGMFSIQIHEAGSGQPTLFLHGDLLPPAPYPWMDQLAVDRHLLAPQHPGFGKSTGLEHLDDVADLTIYYLDFLDALEIEACDLIGESFGGLLAAELAALAPHRVRRLALVAPFGLWLDDLPTTDVFALPALDLHQLCWSDPASTIAREFAPDADDEAQQWRRSIERARSLAAAGKFLWPIPDKGLRKRIHRITAPTLLLWGDRDRIIPPGYAAMFQQNIRSSELVFVAQAGHFPLLEQSTESLAAIRRFLSG